VMYNCFLCSVTVSCAVEQFPVLWSSFFAVFIKIKKRSCLKVHKIENFFDSDFGICVISLLVMSKY
jgi:hypothetical protein